MVFLEIGFGQARLPEERAHGRQGLSFGMHEQRLDRQLGLHV